MTRLTKEEQRTMMTLWCVMPAPLMFGGELTKLDAFTLKLITNRDVLDMEKAIYCAHPLYTREDAAAWMAPRKDGQGCYLALFNLTDEAMELSLPVAEAGLQPGEARELWTGAVSRGDTVSARIAPHDAALWLVK